MLGDDDSYLLILADQLGFYRSFPIVLSLLLIYCYFSIASSQESQIQYKKIVLAWSNILITLFVSLLVMLCVIASLKMFFAFKRPFCHEEIKIIKLLQRALSGTDCLRSFPSGHTAYICTILFSLWPALNHISKAVGALIALSVAISRIASGVHFPADILWAALISFVVVTLVKQTTQKLFVSRHSHSIVALSRKILMFNS